MSRKKPYGRSKKDDVSTPQIAEVRGRGGSGRRSQRVSSGRTGAIVVGADTAGPVSSLQKAADDATSGPNSEPADAALGDLRQTFANWSPMEVRGAPGTAVFGGWPVSNEKDASLTSPRKWETFAGLAINCAIVGSSVRYFLNLISKSKWRVRPAARENEEPTDSAKRAAEMVEAALHNTATPWSRIVRRMATYRFWGFSAQEWSSRILPDGNVGLLDVEPRAQHTIERWDVDIDGTVHGLLQRSPQTSKLIYLPRAKTVYVVDDSLSDSPEGLGLFRHLAEPVSRLRRLEQLELYGYETDLRGVPIGRAPISRLNDLVKNGSITKEAAEAAKSVMSDFVRSHIKNPSLGIILDSAVYLTTDDKQTPSGVPLWGLDLLKSSSGSIEIVGSTIHRINLEISRLMHTEHLLLGGDGKGSHALSRDKSSGFALIIDSALGDLAAVVKRDLAMPITLLNGLSEEDVPEVETESMQWRDVRDVTDALESMSRAGSPLGPNDPVINEVRTMLGVVRAPEEDVSLGGEEEEEFEDQVESVGEDPDEPEEDPKPKSKSKPKADASGKAGRRSNHNGGKS